MKRYLNLGCGNDYKKSKAIRWVNADIDKENKADIYFNAEEGIPFADNTFDFIQAIHVLEHIHQGKFNFVVNEMIRVLKKDGEIYIACPHFSCGMQYSLVEHLTPVSYFTITEQKFPNIKDLEKQINPFRESFPYKKYKIGNFLKVMNFFLRIIPNASPFIYERFFCWVFPVEEVVFKIRKVKK